MLSSDASSGTNFLPSCLNFDFLNAFFIRSYDTSSSIISWVVIISIFMPVQNLF